MSRRVGLASGLLFLGLLLIFLSTRTDRFHKTTYGNSVDGRPLEVWSVDRDGSGGILFLGSIHGSEGAGTPLLEELRRQLERSPSWQQGQRVAIIPNANPDGLAEERRYNRRGIDLNRNFPATNRKEGKRFGEAALSEPESQALHAWLEREQPEIIVSLHQPIACVDYDGPAEAEALAKRMSAACDLPVKKLGSRPGSLGAYFGETLGRSIITLELPPYPPKDTQALWNRYGAALLEAIAFLDERA